jgi:hypothetical protein
MTALHGTAAIELFDATMCPDLQIPTAPVAGVGKRIRGTGHGHGHGHLTLGTGDTSHIETNVEL